VAVRALLNPVIIKEFGLVVFRPGPELLPHFCRGRILLENEPDRLADLPTGEIPAARQPLAEDPVMVPVFEHPEVILRAGGLTSMEAWLLRDDGCQYPHATYHHHELVTMRHEPGALRLCWSCDNKVREHFTDELAGIARANLVAWALSVVRRGLGFDNSHAVTLPELCWWLTLNKLAHVIPESVARQAMRMPPQVIQSVTRESDIMPSVPATSIIEESAKQVVALNVDPDTPNAHMKIPKHKRLILPKYIEWVKTQPCIVCGKPADDAHHLIGHGQGGMGTKAHDIHVIPLCRADHRALHADPKAWEEKHGSQVELVNRIQSKAAAIGVLA